MGELWLILGDMVTSYMTHTIWTVRGTSYRNIFSTHASLSHCPSVPIVSPINDPPTRFWSSYEAVARIRDEPSGRRAPSLVP